MVGVRKSVWCRLSPGTGTVVCRQGMSSSTGGRKGERMRMKGGREVGEVASAVRR